jgi:hypothetical protein
MTKWGRSGCEEVRMDVLLGDEKWGLLRNVDVPP